MSDAFVTSLVDNIDDIEKRIAAQVERMERLTRGELLEEGAALRNMIMQLEGLKVMLRDHDDDPMTVKDPTNNLGEVPK